MSLADLIRGSVRGATATPATPATVHAPRPPSVATVATVAVATPTIAEVEAMPLEAFGRSGLALVVESEVLGEPVLFVADGYRPAPGAPIAYYPDELVELIGTPPADLRRIHDIKRTFPGSRVARPSTRARACAGECNEVRT